ncbi:hypothetical protein LR48_Vigan226s000600 [Vigna angularis]|uniref:Uncharacterized protein n=1 Tax=Phaseolus angularis TaxID=3914 RepID=A0A0L9T667_PHAAN|nr:hypothetical protein LR48_Vigan226s000600 [Vigna angularis]
MLTEEAKRLECIRILKTSRVPSSASSASSEDSSKVDESMEVRKSQSVDLLEKEKWALRQTQRVPSVTLRASQKLAVMCLGKEPIAMARSLCPLVFTNILIIYSGGLMKGDDHDSHCNALLVCEKVEGQGDMLEKMSKVRTRKVLLGEATLVGHVCGINRGQGLRVRMSGHDQTIGHKVGGNEKEKKGRREVRPNGIDRKGRTVEGMERPNGIDRKGRTVDKGERSGQTVDNGERSGQTVDNGERPSRTVEESPS